MRITATGEAIATAFIGSSGGGQARALAVGMEFCPNCRADLASSRVVLDETVHLCDGCLRELPPPGRVSVVSADVAVTAIWNGALLARSARTRHLDGVVYFPPDDVNRHYLTESSRTSVCLSNGRLHFLHVTVAGQRMPDAAWHWPPPSPLSRHLPGHVAFGRDVLISQQP
jgi:uncharacterized protein (DUF427 family)